MNRMILVLFAALAVMVSFAGEAAAVGTTAGDSVANGYFSSTDTVPQSAGKLTIAYAPTTSLADTTYRGPSAAISRAVDTGYDLAALNTPADVNTAKARDTVSYAYVITNKGNATLTINLAAIFSSVGSDTNWGAGAYKIFNDANNNGVWENPDVVVSSLTLAADATDTIVVVVLVPTSAAEDDSSGTRFFVTNNAPYVGSSTTGDMWQNGEPILGNDSYDTQYDTVVTRVVGPNVRVSKAQALESGRARPGDTIIYTITFDNDGSDSAANVVLYDAIPMNTTYVPNSADSAILVSNGFVTAYDDTYSATNFNDTGNTSAKVIRWSLTSQVGPTSGDDRSAVNVTGFNDAGQLSFRVRIN